MPKPISKSTLPRNKKIVFASVTVLIPFLLLVLLEIFLRSINYGPNLSLFVTENLHGKMYYTMNPNIKYRYFSKVEFSPTTSPEYFPTVKEKGTYRIFCLGASTTVGYPYWYNGAFSSFLRDRLASMFPNKKCEIINLGLTATNSYTVVDIAQELPDYQPDLIIVYDGHNEFYGAMGIASRETLGSSRWIAKTYLQLLHLRTFFLLRNGVAHFISLFRDSSGPQERGTMMERLARGKYIPFGSPMYVSGLSIFKENLSELQNICSENKIPVMISTQVSNLRDLPPFISGAMQAAPHFQDDLKKGLHFLEVHKPDSALAVFKKLLLVDSLRADVHYFIGRSYDLMHDAKNALREYVAARDYDQLRFRASSDMNTIIRQACRRETEIMVDIEKVFEAASPDSLIGNNLIVEHLHPNLKGYFLMAKEYANQMRLHHLFATELEWNDAHPLDEEMLWQQRPVTEIDERLAQRKSEILTSSWPFTQNGALHLSEVLPSDTLGIIVEDENRGNVDWLSGHKKAAEYYIRRNEKDKAVREYQTIINQIPSDVQSYLQLAHLYLTMEKIEEVKSTLTASLSVEKTILAYRALGDIALEQNNPVGAVANYEAMAMFTQSEHERLQNGYLLALAYYRSGKIDQARNQLQLLLQMNPTFKAAAELLAKLQPSQ